MRKRLQVLFILLILMPFFIVKFQAQLNLLEKKIQNVATPEVATLMKYSDFPSLDYIGKIDIDIPIYDINFGNLNIPIGLSYNTKGNKVNDIATSVGLGWCLNAGGNLTVRVNDMNDFIDTYSYYSTSTFEPEQSLAWYRQSKGYLTNPNPSANVSLHNDSSTQLCMNYRIWGSDDYFIDSAPDFYYINAPQFRDKFYLTRITDSKYEANFFSAINAKIKNNFTLKPKITCAGYDGSIFTAQGRASVFYQIDKFEIVGENGYIYIFDDFDYSRVREYPQYLTSHDSYQVNNWYLTKIKDPYTNKEVVFEYEEYVNNYEHPSLITLGDINFGNYPIANNIELDRMSSNFVYPYIYNKVTTTKLNPKRIKKIVTNNETIKFEYNYDRIDYPGNGLSKIQISDKNNFVIKSTDFVYSYFNSNNCNSGNYECKRLKLDKLIDSSLGTYSFSYLNNDFPPRNSSKVDFLGYFNNNNSNIIFSKTDFHQNQNYYEGTKIYFYPDLDKDQLLPFRLLNKQPYSITSGIDREPNSISKLGLLEKIVFPTGGKLQINYENDDFMYEEECHILGSTRVSKMSFYDSENNVSKEINYKYLGEDNKSSGQINFIKTPANSARTEISSGIGFNTDAIVGYSRIIEEISGKGFTEKKYSNFNDFPDKFMISDDNFTDQKTKNFLKILKFPNSYVQSFDNRRGKILSETSYKEGVANPIKKVTYEYNYQIKDSLKLKKYFSTYDNYTHDFLNIDYTSSIYLLRYFNNIKSNRIENFLTGGNINEDVFYEYDDFRLKYKKLLIGQDVIEEYYRNSKDKTIQKLIDANILDKTIEIEKKLNGKVVSKKLVNYNNEGNLLPSSELLLDLKNNSMFTEMSYDLYDNKGNIIQYTNKNGMATSIIWDKSQAQPIAKVEGAKLSEISQTLIDRIVDASDQSQSSYTETSLLDKLEAFRNDITLKDFQVTTYTYRLLIGVSSITLPSGIRENYIYDNANRLEKVVDANGRIVSEYKYNYAPEKFYNIPVTLTLTKNNCPSGQVGSASTLSIPSGKYLSYISQADADQKAIDEVQAYANSNGYCSYISCNVVPYQNDSYQTQYSYFQFESASSIKAYLQVNFNSYPPINWQSAVFVIGTICQDLTPSTDRYITPPGTSWQVMITSQGQVQLKWNAAGSPPNIQNVGLNFKYDK